MADEEELEDEDDLFDDYEDEEDTPDTDDDDDDENEDIEMEDETDVDDDAELFDADELSLPPQLTVDETDKDLVKDTLKDFDFSKSDDLALSNELFSILFGGKQTKKQQQTNKQTKQQQQDKKPSIQQPQTKQNIGKKVGNKK
eukprot:UN02147